MPQLVLLTNRAKIKFVASRRNLVQGKTLPKSYQEFQSIKSSRAFLENIQKDYPEA